MLKKKLLLPLAAALAATGCSASHSPAPTVTAVATQTATTTQTASATATRTATATATQTATRTATTTQAAQATTSSVAVVPASSPAGTAPRCIAENLELTATRSVEGTGGGHIGQLLTVKNIGSAACTIGEKPTLVFVTGPQNVERLGETASYTGDSPAIALQPGDRISSELSIAQVPNRPGCDDVPAFALAIVAGDNRYAVAPVDKMFACHSDAVHMISAQPFQRA